MSRKHAGMTTDRFDRDVHAAVAASRPNPDLLVAREAGEVIAHMLGDGRSMIDPATTIWTAEAAEDLRARIGDNPLVGTGQRGVGQARPAASGRSDGGRAPCRRAGLFARASTSVGPPRDAPCAHRPGFVPP